MSVPLARTSVTVRVPATSANIGPGFDCLGVALDIWNDLTVTLAEKEEFILEGEGQGSIPLGKGNLILIGMKAAFKMGIKLKEEEGQYYPSVDTSCSANGQPTEALEDIAYGSLSATASATASSTTTTNRTLNNPIVRRNVCCDKFVAEICDAIRRGEHLDVDLPQFRYHCVNRVPFARGLGSSSTAVVSGLIAGLLLIGVELPATNEEALFNMACAIEGHPDNAAPAIYGGIQLGVKVQIPNFDKWLTSQIPVPGGLQCILFLPDMPNNTCEGKTERSRALLPAQVSQRDAIFNISRIALLIQSLATGNLGRLSIAMDDRLHQPYRIKATPYVQPIITAALDAGAHGASLSGAGPAVLALTSGAKGDIYTQRRCERAECAVADAMLRAATSMGIKGRIFITTPTTQGAHVISVTPPFSSSKVCRFAGGASI